ncbi:hypothetical protein P4576_22845 [Peribacillus frigoritolerans]|uniref:hypothetical protein n=1 Tax=Peribacillus frigoritolerans TaxID=450367 RepID=UPI001DBA1160|nr:hypothetical protein [Peribacillus frigoritolerans]MED3790012.1 hypothetical protein [Peribacillus frigoritolerans]MED3892181.1 hypothetical protein [Peribacillus frigoritolerans]CAH0265480.1 hypothetical protein SRABI80_03328 [Peribacillus frigoritolerans]
MLKEYTTSEEVLTAGESKLAESVMEFYPSRSGQWAWEKAKKIMDSVSRNPFRESSNYEQQYHPAMPIQLIRFKKSLVQIDADIDFRLSVISATHIRL